MQSISHKYRAVDIKPIPTITVELSSQEGLAFCLQAASDFVENLPSEYDVVHITASYQGTWVISISYQNK